MVKPIIKLMVACTCKACNRPFCIHRDTIWRLPEILGRLALCPNLKEVVENE